MSFRRFIIYIIIFFVSISSAFSINYTAERFQKFGMNDGLPSNIVFDITQDNFGYIWCATDEGVCRFDGINFIGLSELGDTSFIAGQQALDVYCEDCYVYIGTKHGLLVYNQESGFSNLYRVSDKKMMVRSIIKRKEGGVWVATYGDGVFSFDINSGSFTKLDYNYSDNRVLRLFETKDGFLYIGTHFGGLDVLNLKDNIVKNYSKTKGNIVDDQVETIYEDSYGNIWVGTWGGLVRFNKDKKNFETFDNLDFKKAKVNCIEELVPGELWVGTEYFLASIKYDKDDALNEDFDVDFIYESNDDGGLSYKTIRSIYADSHNNLWVATYGGGINFSNKSKQKFNYIRSGKNAISYNHVSSFCEDNKGNLWITTDGGGINYWDFKSNDFLEITSENLRYNLSDNAVLCSLIDSDNDLWIGTYNCVLNRMKNGTDRFLHYKNDPNNPNTLMNSDVICLFEDSDKNIWIGQRDGLSYFDKKLNKITTIGHFKWKSVTCVREHNGFLYIGTTDGIFKYDVKNDSLLIIDNKLIGIPINTFLFDKNGQMWIGTDGFGLYKYDFVRTELFLVSNENDIKSRIIKSLVICDEYLLAFTSRELVKRNLKTGLTEVYTASDGLQPGSFMLNAGLLMKNGAVVVGGTEGMNIFYPKEIHKDNEQPKIVFTKFSLFNKEIKPKCGIEPDSFNVKNINYANNIYLKYNEDLFSIGYLGINYAHPELIQYAYRMEGVDKSWNFVGNMRSATYRNLYPGEYVFKVLASSPSGYFDYNKAREIHIYVAPPFWLTWWAFVIYAILFVVAVYGAWNIAMIKVRTREKINNERLEKQKQEELYQSKLQFFANASHELKNPLTLILAPLEKLLSIEVDDKKNYWLSVIKSNTMRVIKNLNGILDIRKIDYGQMTLKVRETEILPIVLDICKTFEEYKNEKNIELIVNCPSLVGYLSHDFFDKIIYNLLSNAFKYVGCNGLIQLDITEENINAEKKIQIIISDNGIGIAKNDLKKIFDCFYQIELKDNNIVYPGSGIGLYLVKSLVKLHRGTISVESELNVGTKFTIILPFDKKSYKKEEFDNETEHIKDVVDYCSKINSCNIENLNLKSPSSKYTVLVADDEKDIREFLYSELVSEYEVLIASNGKEAFELALEHIPDLIISDVIMPECDGIQLCQNLKGNINTSHIPVILLTAKDTHEDRLNGLEVGADSYIPKPFDIRHLHIRIEQLIKTREVLKEKYMKKISLVSKNFTEEENNDSASYDDMLIQKIIQYINENISDGNLNGESIANNVGMSRMNLHRKLKALVGMSAGDFIRTIRLENAKKELTLNQKSVSEISYDSGFSSPSYFYTCFLKKYGISPTEYRNSKHDE